MFRVHSRSTAAKTSDSDEEESGDLGAGEPGAMVKTRITASRRLRAQVKKYQKTRRGGFAPRLRELNSGDAPWEPCCGKPRCVMSRCVRYFVVRFNSDASSIGVSEALIRCAP